MGTASTSNAKPARLAIFRAGKHTSVDGRTLEFSDADIAAIAAGYDPAVAEAPLVVGHPQSLTEPAYGWAKSLAAENGVLYAEPHQVEPQFAELVNAGRLKKISASIYLPDSPGNPTPGKFYLRHIGFLGAAAPAVKGLPSAQFASADGAVEFAQPWVGVSNILVDVLQRVRDWFVENNGADKADQIIPQWQLRTLSQLADGDDLSEAIPSYAERDAGTATVEHAMSEKQAADFAAAQAKLDADAAALKTREEALAKREQSARRTDAAEFAEDLVKEGKLLPRQKAGVVEVLLALPAEPVSFAEADGSTVSKPAAELLRSLLSELPKQVDYAEKSGHRADTTHANTADFAAPAGTVVDAGRMELHRKAKAFQTQHPGTDYIDAVRAVGG